MSDNESTLRKLASEVKSTIIGGTPSDLESAIPSARRLAEEVVEALSFGNLTGALLQQPLVSKLSGELSNMLESKPADLYSVFKSLGIVSEVQDAIGVDQIINNAILKRNEELYLAEINKDTQYLIVDLVNLIADKDIFGQVIDEF